MKLIDANRVISIIERYIEELGGMREKHTKKRDTEKDEEKRDYHAKRVTSYRGKMEVLKIVQGLIEATIREA